MGDEPGDPIRELSQELEKGPRRQRRLLTGQQIVDFFLIGLLGWWLVNVPLWFLFGLDLDSDPGGAGYWVMLFIFGINLLLLIVMAFVNRWVALGLVAAITLNLVVSVVLGLVFNAICWIPFTSPMH